MKRSFFFVLFIVAIPFAIHAQSIVMTPDSGYDGQTLPVTIVGMGTHFEETLNVSNIDVKLERSGQVYAQAYPVHLVNDSTIYGTLSLENLATGYYDLLIQVPDSSFTQPSAFYVTAAPPSIVSVSPSSAYDSQYVYIRVTGQNTNFQNGDAPTIYFMQNGNVVFTAQADSIFSSTSLGAYLSVPSPPTGYYDVIVQNNVYSDTGIEKFRVLGPMPTVALVPDSGMASSTFDVSVVGQGTNFEPTDGVSVPISLNINLKQNGVTYYQVMADTVFSATLADAVFTLSDSISPGTYDAEIYGTTYNNGSYDLYTTFLVTAHHTTIRIPYHYSVAPADTVTLNITGSGVNFIYQGSQFVKSISLVNGAASIAALSIKVTNDTSLSAFFTIPPNASAGFYNVIIVEPGTGRIDTGQSEFSVTGTYIDTACTMSPDSGNQGQEVSGCLFGVPNTIDSMYLQQGASIMPLFVELRLPACLPIGVKIPATASTGLYNLVLVLGGDALGDTAVVKNAFTVVGSASVGDSPVVADLVQNFRVSPNPSQDNAIISFTMSQPSHVRLILYDELGRTVATLCDRTISGAQDFEWNASDMPAGSYFYKLTAGEEMYGGRILVQH